MRDWERESRLISEKKIFWEELNSVRRMTERLGSTLMQADGEVVADEGDICE